MRRYTITLGALTTAGGRVVSASSNGSINGVKIALEGDVVSCPRCKSQGKILCVGPRIPETWNGKQVALENDLCLCACFPSPKLIANQTLRSQVIEHSSQPQSEPSDEVQRKAAIAATPDEAAYSLDFLVLDDKTGLPAQDWPYAVELANGDFLHGRTDVAGKTGRISAADAEHAVLHLYVPEASPITPFWDR